MIVAAATELITETNVSQIFDHLQRALFSKFTDKKQPEMIILTLYFITFIMTFSCPLTLQTASLRTMSSETKPAALFPNSWKQVLFYFYQGKFHKVIQLEEKHHCCVI